MKVNSHGISNVINMYKREEANELAKIYPGEDLAGKYILFLQFDLWFPYVTDKLTAEVDLIYSEGKIETVPFKIRTPYRNKQISLISMKKGRRFCNYGIPLVFNTYEELKSLKDIQVKWQIVTPCKENKPLNIYQKITYHVDFGFEEGKQVYGLWSKDCPLIAYDYTKDQAIREDSLKKYLDEFDTVIEAFTDNDHLCVQAHKGTIGEGKEGETLKIVVDSMGLNTFIETSDNNGDFMLFSYEANVVLEPDVVAKNLMHY